MMFRRSSQVLLKWMNSIPEVNGRINEKRYETEEQNELKEQESNRYPGFSVATARCGPRLSMMTMIESFNHSSSKKYQLDLSGVQTLGKADTGIAASR